MKILGIESSCDDTSVAMVENNNGSFKILDQITASQIDIHKKYGGVVPEVAGRQHAEKIIPLIEEVITRQGEPDILAVTAGPGLITGLLVGVEAAKTLSYLKDIPLVAVNHIEGHIHSVELSKQTIGYSALALIVSGGHTEIIYLKKQGEYRRIGSTRDDAAGECFDKVAKLLDLPYPGGPQISALAKNGNAKKINFPRPMMEKNNFDFSFSGLKTAALYWLQENKLNKTNNDLADFCASFEQAIIDVLTTKVIWALEKNPAKTVIVGGGVSANKKLRENFKEKLENNLLLPKIEYAMDNGAMIAVAGYYKAKSMQFTDWRSIKADPNWKIYE